MFEKPHARVATAVLLSTIFVVSLSAEGVTAHADPPAPATCAPVRDQERLGARMKRGVFGWFQRYVRNTDVERNGTPVPFYLRSPLLTSFPGPDCEPVVETAARVCALVTIDRGAEADWHAAVVLPQLHATSAEGLARAIRERRARGDGIRLRTIDGADVRLDAAGDGAVSVRSCLAGP